MDSIGSFSSLAGPTYSTGTSGGTGTTSTLTSGSDTTSTISDKQMYNASLVTSTLDKLNSVGSGGGSDYDFQKTILNGKAASIGLNLKA